MNIKELNERIEQLTKLVISADETIKNAKEMIVLAEQERDRLCDQQRESEPKFERKVNEEFYYIEDNGSMEVCSCYDGNDIVSTNQFKGNNYFHTEERAQEVADKINLLLKLERLHDTFCPDYVSDWNNYNERKYVVNVVYKGKGYSDKGELVASHTIGTKNFAEVYFPTLEIAQKVCDILNAEERSKDV